MTDTVPAEIPLVAGVISAFPATPNSHVAILSRSFRIPFVHLAREEDWARVRAWDGQEMILLAEVASDRCSVQTINVAGQLSESQRARLLEAKRVAPLAVVPLEVSGRLSLVTDTLVPEDIRFVGGKAANFGLLRRSIPESSPTPAIAFTFDLWTSFMDQTVAGGKTLRETISEKLSRYTFPPVGIAALKNDLEDVRRLIRNSADFSASQKAAILDGLAPFDGESLGNAFDFVTEFEYHDGESVHHFSGAMSQLPDSRIQVQDKTLIYSWSLGEGGAKREYRLAISFPVSILGEKLVALSEATLIELSVQYASPQPRLDSGLVTSEKTQMMPLGRIIERTTDVKREFQVVGRSGFESSLLEGCSDRMRLQPKNGN